MGTGFLPGMSQVLTQMIHLVLAGEERPCQTRNGLWRGLLLPLRLAFAGMGVCFASIRATFFPDKTAPEIVGTNRWEVIYWDLRGRVRP